MNRLVGKICRISAFATGIGLLLAAFFLTLYKIKCAMGLDFFPEIHLRNIIEEILPHGN